MWIIMKNQHLVPKNNIFVEIRQQWCYVASASFIASGALHDDCTQNLVLEVKISENLDFWQFLKIEFELHIYVAMIMT